MHLSQIYILNYKPALYILTSYPLEAALIYLMARVSSTSHIPLFIHQLTRLLKYVQPSPSIYDLWFVKMCRTKAYVDARDLGSIGHVDPTKKEVNTFN